MRVNRYLALKGYSSRREADALISKGIVTINGKKASLGDKVSESDVVEVDKTKKKGFKNYIYLAYNKSRGIVTHSPEEGQKDIRQAARLTQDIFPVGRLDRDSEGLILLTNDGRMTDKLLNPEREHEKEYVVRVNKPITNIFVKVMQQGVELEDFKTKPCIVKKKDDFTFHITLTEGKKHQIRRMCAAMGWSVASLRRVRIMNIHLGALPKGQKRILSGQELTKLLSDLGIK